MDAKIPAATKHFTFSSLPNFFVYDPITESEVYSQILQLIHLTKVFKNIIAYIISTYLNDTFNKCHEIGIFPIL